MCQKVCRTEVLNLMNFHIVTHLSNRCPGPEMEHDQPPEATHMSLSSHSAAQECLLPQIHFACLELYINGLVYSFVSGFA